MQKNIFLFIKHFIRTEIWCTMYLENIMQEKKNIISIIMFSIYTAFLVFFAISLIWGGQKISGAVYFVIFAVSLAFAVLERKYGASYKSLYRFSIYIADFVNICALVSFIYYGLFVPVMAVSLGIYVACLIVDLLSKNRNKQPSKLNIGVLVLNCLFMVCVFPFFFEMNIHVSIALISLVLSIGVLAIKIVLACSHELDEKVAVSDEISDKIKSEQEERVE